MGEFERIKTYFKRPCRHPEVVFGVGDDAALLEVAADQQLVITVDTLNEDVHFSKDMPAAAIAYKAMAVNLSDLAAMGAVPRYFTLSLSLPSDMDDDWLAEFSKSLWQVADQYSLDLIGGDTCRHSALSISIQMMGLLPRKMALHREGAKVGDDIYVTGTIGDAGLALKTQDPRLLLRLHYPTPRVSFAQQLHKKATACIDVSDGLLADLQHILTASQVGACVNMASIPLSDAFLSYVDPQITTLFAATCGDDYELCFTAPVSQREDLQQLAHQEKIRLTLIGTIIAGSALLNETGDPLTINPLGWQHF